MINVTNVWFGAARCKPCQPVVISEQGIKFVFKDGDKSRWIYCSFALSVLSRMSHFLLSFSTFDVDSYMAIY